MNIEQFVYTRHASKQLTEVDGIDGWAGELALVGPFFELVFFYAYGQARVIWDDGN
jgi:hypothetical protein